MIGRIEGVLQALNDARVRYLVVGGVAVVLHGHLRTTADLDLVVQLEPENIRRALAALGGAGFRPRAPVRMEDFADEEIRSSWIADKSLEVFSLWHPEMPGFEVDVFVTEPFDFDDCYARRVEARLERTLAPVVALADLIDMKSVIGRPRDREDEAALRAIVERIVNDGSGE
jgi:hypothetical protein